MNPPFNEAHHQPSPDPARRLAHAAGSGLLSHWIDSARTSLRDGGTITLIWRAEGLPDVLQALASGFGAVCALPVHPAPGRPAIRAIVAAEKGGRGPTSTLPPLMLNDESLRPTAEAEAVLRQGAPLPISVRQTI